MIWLCYYLEFKIENISSLFEIVEVKILLMRICCCFRKGIKDYRLDFEILGFLLESLNSYFFRFIVFVISIFLKWFIIVYF